MIKENFVELLHEGFQRFWDQPMYTNYPDGCAKKYAEVAQEITKMHFLFDELEIKKGDKISLLGRNSCEWAVAYLATVTYGAVSVPILPDFKADDVHHIVSHSESVLLFTDLTLWKTLKSKEMPTLRASILLNDFSFGDVGNELNGLELHQRASTLFEKQYPIGVAKERLHFAEIHNKDLVVLNYTSGTTGFSKGVMISANSLAGNILYGKENIPVEESSTIVSFLPLAHTYGCAFDFLLSVIMGLHVHFISKLPSPQILIPAFQKIKPQIVLSVPLILEKIYKNKIIPKISTPSMKVLLSIPLINVLIYKKIKASLMETFGGNLNEVVLGGAPLNAEAEAFFRKIKFPIAIGYGMTECGPLISYDGWKTTKAGSAGKLLPTMEMKIESNDPYNVPGEICVRGENVMDGYYKNEAATKEVVDDEGWLHTGDMGITDKNNYVFIRGRSKNMLLGSNGQNIYPEEIEAQLNNLEYVSESLVLQDKDHKLYALVYPDMDALKQNNISEDELITLMEQNRKHLNKMVRKYEVVSRIEMHKEEFIKTPKRSIKRYLYEK